MAGRAYSLMDRVGRNAAEIQAICDIHQDVIDSSIDYVVKAGFARLEHNTGSEDIYDKMLEYRLLHPK